MGSASFTFNIGLTLAYPFESRYSIWRRFLSANQRLKMEEICEIFDVPFNSAQDRRLAVGCMFPQLLQTMFAPQGVPGYLDLFEPIEHDTNFYHIDRHCPDCAASGYHTDLYRLPWLTECPIHQKKLVDQCPECDKDWPAWDEIGKRKCPACGLINLATKNECHPRLTQRDFYDIKRLMAFVSFRPLNPGSLRSEKRILFDSSKCTSYFHKSFPAIQSCRISLYQQHSQGLRVTQNTPNITIYQAPLQKIEGLIARRLSQELSLREKPYLTREIQKQVFQRIASEIEATPSEGHNPRIYNLALLNPEDLIGSKPICLQCLALSFWLVITRSASSAEKVHNSAHFRSNSWILPDDQIRAPKYWDYFVSSGCFYKIDRNLSKALYEMELEHLYVSLLISLKKVRNVAKKSREVLEVMWPRFFNELTDRFSLFFEHLTEGLQVFVVNRCSLSEQSLLKHQMSSKQCSEFERFLFHKHLYYSPDSDLNQSEIDMARVFEDNPIYVFDRKFWMPSLRLS